MNQCTKDTTLQGMYFFSCFLKFIEGLLIGHCVAQMRYIFTLLNHLCCDTPLLPWQLVYIEWYMPFHPPNPDSKLHLVSQWTENHGPAAIIVPLRDIMSSCY